MRLSFDRANAPQFAYTGESRQLALDAIKEACSQIGQSHPVVAISQPAEKPNSKTTPGLLKQRVPLGLLSRIAASLLGLIGIGAAILLWQSNLGRAEPEPPTASIADAKINQPASVASERPDTMVSAQSKPTAPELPAAPRNISPDSTAPTSSAELTRQLQNIARDLANVEQGLDQLKSEQAQMARDNAELNTQLKAMREVTRQNVELMEGLKAAQEQTAREISGLGERLKANQELMATVAGQLKENQEQARLAAEQKQRIARKLAPKLAASPTGPPPQAQRNVQPRQQ